MVAGMIYATYATEIILTIVLLVIYLKQSHQTVQRKA